MLELYRDTLQHTPEAEEVDQEGVYVSLCLEINLPTPVARIGVHATACHSSHKASTSLMILSTAARRDGPRRGSATCSTHTLLCNCRTSSARRHDDIKALALSDDAEP